MFGKIIARVYYSPVMNLDELKAIASADAIESEYVKALWYDQQGDWDMAHNVSQDIHDQNGSWIHAYLHRKEGDIWNADYWYRRAGRKRPDSSLEEEWEEICRALLEAIWPVIFQ